ncbi:phage tail tape measure protein, partial [Vibrio anguillarum]|nr:phage tail tape measure protein [Vibrio anguillarum]
ILPGVGTVIGGLAGSFLGDYGGELLGGWFGDKLTNPPDKLMASSDVQSKIEEKERKESLARSLPPIQISTPIYAAPGMDEQKLASLARQEVANALQQQFGSLSGLSIDDSLSISAIDRS